MERNGQQQGPMERNYKSSRTAESQVDQSHSYKKVKPEEQCWALINGTPQVCTWLYSLNLLLHDLRVPVGSLSWFKLSLPQCKVPGVLNCMSGRLNGFPSLY